MSIYFVIFDQFIDDIVEFTARRKRAGKSVKSAVLLIGADTEGGHALNKGLTKIYLFAWGYSINKH